MTDDERVGLGWEVWFLLAVLAGWGLVALGIIGVLIVGFTTG